MAVDEGEVELLGERLRRGIGDLELHRDHGALALLYQHRGDAREGIIERGPRSVAGVEHDKLQGVLATDQLGDRVGLNLLPLPGLVAQQEDRIALGGERTVPDEMQDVERILQLPLQRPERAILDPFEIDLVLAPLQRFSHSLLLARYVEIAVRVGDDAEHADLALHEVGPCRFGRNQLANDGAISLTGEVLAVEAEELPRDAKQLGLGGHVEPHPHGTLAARFIEHRCDISGEQRIRQRRPELPRGDAMRGHRGDLAGR